MLRSSVVKSTHSAGVSMSHFDRPIGAPSAGATLISRSVDPRLCFSVDMVNQPD